MQSKNDAEKVQMSCVTGAGASTKISVTGMVATDIVKSVVNLTDGSQVALAGLAEEAGGFSITAATTGKTLLVLWIDKSAG